MRRRIAAFLVAMLSVSLVTSTWTKAEVRRDIGSTASGTYEEGIVLVKYVAKAPQMDDVTLLEEYQFPSFSIGRFYSKRYTTEQMMSTFIQLDDVIYVEPDYKYEIYAMTEETLDDNQWYIGKQDDAMDERNEQSITTSYSLNQLITATEKDAETVIAVADTGIDYMQPDLVEHMWVNQTTLPGEHGYDIVNEDTDPMDDDGHGTDCASLIVDESMNQVDIAGFHPNIKIMIVKNMDENGIGLISQAVEAYQYIIEAKDQGVNVVAINNSWGSIQPSRVLEDIIREAGDKGIISVCIVKNFLSNPEEEKPYKAFIDSPYVIMAAPSITAKIAVLAQLFPEEAAARIRARVIGSDDDAVSSGILGFAREVDIQKAIHNPYAVVNHLESTNGELALSGYFFGEEEGTVAINGEAVPVIRWGDTLVVVDYNRDFDGTATITLFRGDDLSTTEQRLTLTSVKYASDEASERATIVPNQEEEQGNIQRNENDNEAKGMLWTFVIVAAIIVACLILLVLLFGRKNRKK